MAPQQGLAFAAGLLLAALLLVVAAQPRSTRGWTQTTPASTSARARHTVPQQLRSDASPGLSEGPSTGDNGEDAMVCRRHRSRKEDRDARRQPRRIASGYLHAQIGGSIASHPPTRRARTYRKQGPPMASLSQDTDIHSRMSWIVTSPVVKFGGCKHWQGQEAAAES